TYTKEKIGPGTPHEVKPVSPPPTTNEPSIKDQNKPIIEKPKTDNRTPVIVQRDGEVAAVENGGGLRKEGNLTVESRVSLVKRGYSPAQLLTEAKSYYSKTATQSRKPEDFQAVKEALESVGNNLDGEGAYLLSYIHNQGLAGKTDGGNALKYAAKSSEKGWTSGQYYHGFLLLKNKTAKDSTTARKLLENAASKGNAEAKSLLGKLKPATTDKTRSLTPPSKPTKPAKPVKPTPKNTDDI
ncbi:MAG: tetratricopeptide repeat protein, partial [Bacteroidia bacterium]